jgi:hypothetical protein
VRNFVDVFLKIMLVVIVIVGLVHMLSSFVQLD